MKEVYSEISQFRGSHEAFGYEQGLRVKESNQESNYGKQQNRQKVESEIDVDEVKRMISAISKPIWRELLGVQEALEWPMERVLVEFGGYRTPYQRSGCSISTGNHYMIRNYDYHPKTYEARYSLFQPSDDGYAIAGPSQRLTGRMDGMNEAGLAMGYNFMNRVKPGSGFICCMIARFVLEACATIEEAVKLLHRIPHRHSFSYIVYDKSGRTAIVEATPRRTYVRSETYCTNHFEQLQEENRYHLLDSKRRSAILSESKEQQLSAKEAYALFTDPNRGIFSDSYSNWSGTIHTAVYFPQELKTWFVIGANQKPYEINFYHWLQGEDITDSYFTGKINTKIPFLQMDYSKSVLRLN